MNEIPKPINSEEKFLYAIAVRLDALCHMMSSFMEHYAKQNEVATTSNKIEEKIPEDKPKKKRKPRKKKESSEGNEDKK